MSTRDRESENGGEELESQDEDNGDEVWTFDHGALAVNGWRTEFGGDHLFFERREVGLEVRNGDEKIASASFVEWKAKDSHFEWENFLFDADESSDDDLECADVLRQYWDTEEWPFEYGNLVILERLRIPRSHPDIWPALEAAIQREFMQSGSLMVLKAFPLEWRDKEHEGNPVFEHRLEALKRLYVRRLGVASFHGGGNEDWMWKPLRYCPEPRNEPFNHPVPSSSVLGP